MRCARGSLAFACALACGPDTASPAMLEEVCGSTGAFRLLPLADDERLRGVRRIGDRSYFIVETMVALHDDVVPTTRLVATGPCGETPVDIAQSVFLVFEHERWPERVLGCSAPDAGAFVVLDPAGVASPRTVMAAPACRGTSTEHGIVGVLESEGSTRTLVRVPWPDDLDGPATEAIALADEPRGAPFYPEYAVRGNDVLTVDRNGDLLRIALPSGATSVEQAQVGEWGVSSDGRVLAWRDFDPLVDPGAFTVGTLHLRDRMDGRAVDLEDVALHALPPIASSDWFAVTHGSDTRLVELPSFATRDVPGDIRIANELLDGRLLVSSPLAILDPTDGELVALADVDGELRGGAFDHVDVFAPQAGATEGAVWRVPFDGAPAEALAERATRAWFELDGTVVTPLDVDHDGLGALVQIDPESLSERIIDEHVVVDVIGRGEQAAFHERDVVYSVVDGERSGVWVARLAHE